MDGSTGADPTSPAPTSATEDDGADDSEDAATMSPSTSAPGEGDKPRQTALPSTPGAEASLPLGAVPDAIVQRDDVQTAIAAEAKRTGVEPDAVTVAGYADVTWNDGSLGCPTEGMMYTQALVPGHQLVLEVDGSYASYHAAEGKTFSFCAQPVAPAPSQSFGGPVTDR
ncbi:hypothetical protein [Serinicoccus kebangsaanensis]|uniref:hypothetical protein n=1 Tax=Serinicoccus kebangsaanensis TaxID=2602069 RepID=UPI00124F2223|nr:hypothetical protein [Serinicoccus kebangsaanensis]